MKPSTLSVLAASLALSKALPLQLDGFLPAERPSGRAAAQPTGTGKVRFGANRPWGRRSADDLNATTTTTSSSASSLSSASSTSLASASSSWSSSASSEHHSSPGWTSSATGTAMRAYVSSASCTGGPSAPAWSQWNAAQYDVSRWATASSESAVASKSSAGSWDADTTSSSSGSWSASSGSVEASQTHKAQYDASPSSSSSSTSWSTHTTSKPTVTATASASWWADDDEPSSSISWTTHSTSKPTVTATASPSWSDDDDEPTSTTSHHRASATSSSPSFKSHPSSSNSTAVLASVPFSQCFGTRSSGSVQSVTVSPCERGKLSANDDPSEDDSPCRFTVGHTYTITLNYTSALTSSDAATSSVVARDDSTLPSTRYPYSGQSFSACEYTTCPITADVPASYVYKFFTMESPMNNLVFNVSREVDGPSLFCVGMDVVLVNGTASR